MPCYHPIKAYQCQDGSVVFTQLARSNISRDLELPCGQCVGCRLERSRQWAMRCMHEAQLYDRNCFLTLTYDDDHLPPGRSLDHDHFQRFLKRLRKSHKGFNPVTKTVDGVSTTEYPIRFYMCGEYGDKTDRPHYHAGIFNFDFEDKRECGKSQTGHPQYRSPTLEKLWPYGKSVIGQLNFQSAAYMARYIMKKVTGDLAESHYTMVDPLTGEVFKRTPEYNQMSRRPGIGHTFYKKYGDSVYRFDSCIVNGKEVKPPKYYDRLHAKAKPLDFEQVQYSRELNARQWSHDNTPDRLNVKETVALARIASLLRSVE